MERVPILCPLIVCCLLCRLFARFVLSPFPFPSISNTKSFSLPHHHLAPARFSRFFFHNLGQLEEKKLTEIWAGSQKVTARNLGSRTRSGALALAQGEGRRRRGEGEGRV